MSNIIKLSVRHFNTKVCVKCNNVFTPNSGRQIRCETCMAEERKIHDSRNHYIRKVKAPKPIYYYHGGNFHSKAEEVQRMKELRAAGFSNVEIAKKIGRNAYTVWRNIGAQPEEMSSKNRQIGRANYAKRNAEHRLIAANILVSNFNKLVERAEETANSIRDLTNDHHHMMEEIASMLPEVMKASKVADIKPNMPEPQQMDMDDVTSA